LPGTGYKSTVSIRGAMAKAKREHRVSTGATTQQLSFQDTGKASEVTEDD